VSRKLVVTQYISIDGVIEDPVGMEGSGLGDWTGPFQRGPEGDRVKFQELSASDALLFGRATYEAFAAVWPTVKDEAGFADRINGLPKYVASRKLAKADWNNTTIWRGDVAEEVKRLKAEQGGDVLVYGSAALAHTLIEHGLVDEFNLMVYPVVLGRGKKLFPEGAKLELALMEGKQLGSGIMLLRYRTKLAQPGQ
jgi:dihydrofolate reductase